MVTPFEKPSGALDEQERALLNAAGDVLASGDRLYGLMPEDASHIWWAVGVAMALIRKEREESPFVAMYLEIGADDKGMFVAVVTPDESEEEPVL